MGKQNYEGIKRTEFRGTFGVDGVFGGDTYPYWEVDENTYQKVIGRAADSDEILPNGKVKLYLHHLVDYTKEGTKQRVRLVIEE